jgi:hypothetical protein
MDVPAIAHATFTSQGRVCDVLDNSNLDRFDSLYPAQRREINQVT